MAKRLLKNEIHYHMVRNQDYLEPKKWLTLICGEDCLDR